ncbi:hypothetical protein BKN51_35875 [Amycolatopsis sp. BJA-103]|nr:hypothetical protein BKN51_35875 [Amycolatopsis sp. BJA-103]
MPDFQRNGLLVPGVHRMPLDAVEAIFVQGCDHFYNRQRIFDALRLMVELVPVRFGLSTILVSGPFIAKDTRAPHYAHVAIIPRSHTDLKKIPPEQAVKIMTIGSVMVGRPELMSFTQIDPMGGLVRSWIAYEDDEIEIVRGMLRTAVDRSGNPLRGVEQGYVELESCRLQPQRTKLLLEQCAHYRRPVRDRHAVGHHPS